MSPSALRIRRIALLALVYLAWTMLALLVTFAITFPYDALERRLKTEAANFGYNLRVGSLGAGFFSVRARDVTIASQANSDRPPFRIEAIALRPGLFPLGPHVDIRVLGGTVAIGAGGIASTAIDVRFSKLNLASAGMKEFTGVALEGTLEGVAHLDLPKASDTKEPDLTQASGMAALTGVNVGLLGGVLTTTIPAFGPDPIPFDVPRLALGEVNARLVAVKGAVSIDTFKTSSPDLQTNLSGSLKLGQRLGYSDVNADLRLKLDDEAKTRLGILGGAVTTLAADPKDPTWRLGHLSGYLGSPRIR